MSLPPLVFAAGVAIVVPSIIGLIMFRGLPSDLKPLSFLFVIHAVITIVQFFLAYKRINNIWTSHIYNIIEVALLLGIFSLWTDSRKARLIFWSIMGLYVILWIVAKVIFEQFDLAPVYTPMISRIILLTATIYIILFIGATTTERVLAGEPKFWFAAGFLLAYAGSLMFYGFKSLINDLPYDEIVKIWSIHWVVTILSNSFFIAGFVCVPLVRNTGGQLELAQ